MKTKTILYVVLLAVFVIAGNASAYTEGGSNNYFGTYAGGSGGSENSFFGAYAGDNNTGWYNTFVGYEAGNSNTTGGNNTFIGTRAGNSNISGFFNTFIGEGAGNNNTSGYRNVFIGFQAGWSETGSNKLYIDSSTTSTPLIYGEFDNGIVGIDGRLGVGTQTPGYELHIHNPKSTGVWLQLTTKNTGTGLFDGFFWGIESDNTAQFWSESGMPIVMVPGGGGWGTRTTFQSNGRVGIGVLNPTEKLYVAGNIYATGSVTWGSSRELKENIRELSANEAVSALNNLSPKKYYYKADGKDEHIGFIAEDVPELLATKDRKSLDPMDIVAVLTKVVQEQQRKFDEYVQQQQKTIEHQKRIAEQQQKTITELTERLNEVERDVKLKGSLASVMN